MKQNYFLIKGITPKIFCESNEGNYIISWKRNELVCDCRSFFILGSCRHITHVLTNMADEVDILLNNITMKDKFCRSCGTKFADEDKFCGNCGKERA